MSNNFVEYRDVTATIGDLNALYHLERLFHGMVNVFEVTGEKQIVSELLDICLKIIDAGKDLNGDGYLDYCFRDESGNPQPASPGEPACDSDPELMCTYPWRAMRGPARTLRAAVSAGLHQTRTADVEKLRSFLAKHVIDKWLDLDGTGQDHGQGGSHTAGIDSRMALLLHRTTSQDLAGGAVEQGRCQAAVFRVRRWNRHALKPITRTVTAPAAGARLLAMAPRTAGARHAAASLGWAGAVPARASVRRPSSSFAIRRLTAQQR